MTQDRLAAQMAFLTEACKLKSVNRANRLTDGSRVENSAEHSWHLALWVMIFSGNAPKIDLHRLITMALLHDLVEIDAGDHPIHLDHSSKDVAALEATAAKRLFAILPSEQGHAFEAIWHEFDSGQSDDARFARLLDKTQPMFQELATPTMTQEEHAILRDIYHDGRFADLAQEWPEAHAHAGALLHGTSSDATGGFLEQLRFLQEADKLKNILRGTTLCDGSRRENSGEHSWHIALYALVLAEYAIKPVRIDRVVQMLVIHDLVEIDAGDNPIHGDHDPLEQERIERLAADRIYGLLPQTTADDLRSLWEEFEAAQSDDAVFAKSIDRVQPVISNLETNGGTWPEYNVTLAQLEERVGIKVQRGAPAVWEHLRPRIENWFASQEQVP